MKTLSEEFREIRRVSTPFVVVQTSDYRVTIKELSKVRVNGEDAPNIVIWNQVDGPTTKGDSNLGSFTDHPFIILKNALHLPPGSILFWVVPDDFASGQNHHWSNAYTVQAVANIRDNFKDDQRTLVILSIDGKLPSLISDDVPLLKDPLPTEEQLVTVAEGVVTDANKKLEENGKKKIAVEPATIVKAAKLCRGMNRFAAEEAVSRNLNVKGIDLDSLANAQRMVIEATSDRALTFFQGTETFDDIGGLHQIKSFATDLFNGINPPRVIVQIEEIEKAMAGIGGDHGGGDSTGVSQDQLGVLLDEMENNEWSGILLVGHAGVSKTLFSKAVGNTHGVKTIKMDLGACMGKYVGESQGKIRKTMGVLKAYAGKDAYFIGTSNSLGIIPPALRRRFADGVWFSDLPSKEERQQIWAINLKKFGIDSEQDRPDDKDWTGSDIRNVCRLAYRLRCSLIRAATYIVPVSKSDPAAIERLRTSAHGKFLSVSEAGVYRQPEEKKGRKISI